MVTIYFAYLAVFASASEASVHYVKADAAQCRVLKSLGSGSADVKSECLPQSNGDVVRFHNGVELHSGVPLLAGPGERVLAERAPDSPASRIA
jgi:hypothetical protein